jgi:hypothetical protein
MLLHWLQNNGRRAACRMLADGQCCFWLVFTQFFRVSWQFELPKNLLTHGNAIVILFDNPIL